MASVAQLETPLGAREARIVVFQKAIWDVAKPTIMAGVKDVELRITLARSFELLHELELLVGIIAEQVYGVSSTLSTSTQVVKLFGEYTETRATHVKTFLDEACNEIDNYIARELSTVVVP
jgi:hypothetical protein